MNQTNRVIELIKRINNNNTICIKALQNEEMWYQKSERTILRDLHYLKKYFDLKLVSQGCYKAFNTSILNNLLNPKDLSMILQTFNIVNRTNLLKNLNISKEDKSLIQKHLNSQNNIYDFKTPAIEENIDFEKFQKLEYLIKYQKYTKIKYKNIQEHIQYFDIKPYKIIFLNGNFYLASEVENQKFIFTLFRISRILNIIEENKEFHKKNEISNFISSINTPFAKYSTDFRKNMIDVEIELNQNISKYFEEKKFFPSQNIKIENNKTIVSYKVTNLLEIKNFFKQWIPDIKIIKPKKLEEMIKEDIKKFL